MKNEKERKKTKKGKKERKKERKKEKGLAWFKWKYIVCMTF